MAGCQGIFNPEKRPALMELALFVRGFVKTFSCLVAEVAVA
jgi:hypothetical protein